MTTRCFYSLVGVEPDAPPAEIQAACECVLDAAESRDDVPEAQRAAAEILRSPTTRRMYDFLRRHADAAPPENAARFRDERERRLYAAYAGAWGFRMHDGADHNSARIERAGDEGVGTDPPHIMFPKLPSNGSGDRPPMGVLTLRPRDGRVVPTRASKEHPVFTPQVTNTRRPANEVEQRREWPLEPVLCGRHVYRIRRHTGFIEEVYATPSACHATCHIHGDRSVTFEASYWHPAAFSHGFRPGDEAIILSVFDPTEDQVGGTYAMVTSTASLMSFEPPSIYEGRWQSPSPRVYFDVKTTRQEKLARYRYHFALRAASIEHAFDWTEEPGHRDLVIATNRYIAEIHPSLKALCRPR